MDSLVLLILGAVWAAVLIPPLLRSRLENRPNSSVTDFRRQLNKLQNTVPSRATSQARMGRPLAQSPLQRPAVGRSGMVQPTARRNAPVRRHGGTSSGRVSERVSPQRSGRGDSARQQPRRYADQGFDRRGQHGEDSRARRQPRSHGAPTGSTRRPDRSPASQRRTGGHRQTHLHRDDATGGMARKRRSNVLLAMIGMTGVALFLAATTKSTGMLYLFALSFIALCGYLYLLSSVHQRETAGWGNDWMS